MNFLIPLSIIKAMVPIASKDESRGSITGILAESWQKDSNWFLTLTATDGRMMVNLKCDLKTWGNPELFRKVIPVKLISMLRGAPNSIMNFEDGPGDTITAMAISSGGLKVSMSFGLQNYPDYSNIFFENEKNIEIPALNQIAFSPIILSKLTGLMKAIDHKSIDLLSRQNNNSYLFQTRNDIREEISCKKKFSSVGPDSFEVFGCIMPYSRNGFVKISPPWWVGESQFLAAEKVKKETPK